MQLFSIALAVAVVSSVSAAAFVPASRASSRSTVVVLQNDLWGEPPEKDGQAKEMSKALPFAPRPKLLDGTLAGDVGFE